MVLALWSLWIIGAFGFYTLGVRLWTQVDGIVISARDMPPSRGPRYATEYKLRNSDGHETVYVAGPTGSSLPRSMPVGTAVRKRRWHLSYEKNGRQVDDFGLPFYSVILTIGFGGLIWSWVLSHRQNPSFR
jgi:hypothetical protein